MAVRLYHFQKADDGPAETKLQIYKFTRADPDVLSEGSSLVSPQLILQRGSNCLYRGKLNFPGGGVLVIPSVREGPHLVLIPNRNL